MTLIIIALNILIYLAFNVANIGSSVGENFAAIAFGYVPSVANDIRTLPASYQIIPDNLYPLNALSSSFLHGGWFHLLGNMLFIWVFGDNVEDALGHFKFLIFYLVCAFAAAWFHAFVFAASDAPLIGASGAASGVVAAYLMLHPKMKIWVLFLGRIPLKLPAFIILGGWILYQVGMFVFNSGDQISWAAHIGGIASGAILVVFLKRREVPLFDREIVMPESVNMPDDNVIEPQSDIKWGR